MHWIVALHCVLAGTVLGRDGRACFAGGLLAASAAFAGYAVLDDGNAFTGALGNTGSISEAGLAGAVAGAGLAAFASGWKRIAGLATLALFLFYTARVPVLAGSLACAAGVAALVMAARKEPRSRMLVAVGCLALALVALTIPFASRARPAPVANAPAVSTSPAGGVGVRLLVWRGSMSLFAEHPLLGVGAGQFAARFPEHRLQEEIERTTYGRRRAEETEVEHPHNDWLAPWLEGGIAAGLPWTIFLVLAALAAWRKLASRDPVDVALAASALALLVNALVRGPLLQNPASSPLAFALFGVVLARDPDGMRSFARRALVIGSSLLLAAVAFRAWAFFQHGRALQAVTQSEVDVDDVRAATVAALDACPDSVLALTTSARLSAGRRDAAPIAIEEWTKVLELRPQRIEALLSVGRLLAAAGESARAEHAFDRVLRLDPNHPVAEQNKATLALNAGRVSAGLAWLDRMPATRAPTQDWLEHLAALLALRGIDDSADALFARVDPATAGAGAEQCLEFAKRAEEAGRDKLVVEAWKARAQRRWARRHAADGRFADAVRSYRQDLRVCEINTFEPRRVRLELSAALERAGRAEEARAMRAGLEPTPEDLAAVPDWARETLRASLEEAKK
jgi:O-antigen ligase